jgi:hypothetical protein
MVWEDTLIKLAWMFLIWWWCSFTHMKVWRCGSKAINPVALLWAPYKQYVWMHFCFRMKMFTTRNELVILFKDLVKECLCHCTGLLWSNSSFSATCWLSTSHIFCKTQLLYPTLRSFRFGATTYKKSRYLFPSQFSHVFIKSYSFFLRSQKLYSHSCSCDAKVLIKRRMSGNEW